MTMPQAKIHSGLNRKAFTFAEVMFAVVILGVGFIMLAGMFPVAIEQTRATQSEGYANPMIQNAIQTLMAASRENAQDAKLISDVTAVGYAVPDTLFTPYSIEAGTLPSWGRIKGELISNADNRYAWTPLYRYRKGDVVLETTLIACQAYDQGVGFISSDQLIPRQVAVSYASSEGVSTVSIKDPNLATGSFLIIGIPGFPTQILRLGNNLVYENGVATFELYPNYGTLPKNFPASFSGWVVGKNLSVSDISVVTTCIPVAPWTPPY